MLAETIAGFQGWGGPSGGADRRPAEWLADLEDDLALSPNVASVAVLDATVVPDPAALLATYDAEIVGSDWG